MIQFVITLEKLQEIAAGNKEFVLKMLDLLEQSLPPAIEDTTTALNGKDLARIKSITHKIKPSIDMTTDGNLIELVREVEKLAQEGNANSYLEERVHLLLSQYSQLLEGLREVIKNYK